MSSGLNTPTGKISLASTSKISLHERFTKLAKETPVLKDTQNKPVQLKSSEKNRKLALQMANRPSVQAALKIKNKTLKQRLGSGQVINQKPALKLRLGNQQQQQQQVQRKSLKQRLGPTLNKTTPIRLSGRIKILGTNGQPRVINTGRNGNNNNFKFRNQTRINNNQAFVINRVNTNNGFKKKFQRVKNLKGKLQTAGITTKNFRNNFRRNTKQLKNNNNNNKPNQIAATVVVGGGGGVSTNNINNNNREKLDNDLDSYMSKTKSHLDNDLDSYMAQQQQQ